MRSTVKTIGLQTSDVMYYDRSMQDSLNIVESVRISGKLKRLWIRAAKQEGKDYSTWIRETLTLRAASILDNPEI